MLNKIRSVQEKEGRRYKILLLLWVSASLSACASAPGPPEGPTMPGGAAFPTPTVSTEEIFELDVWVDNAQPEIGQPIVLYGSLIKHGVHLGAINMNAYWPDGDRHPRVPDCRVQVIYGSGVCKVNTADFPAGVPTTIFVEFAYQGNRYLGSVNITAQR